jgi:hypothetical protein
MNLLLAPEYISFQISVETLLLHFHFQGNDFLGIVA